MRSVLLALLSAALFGASTPASKALLEGLGPLQLAGLLYLGAAIGCLPAVAIGGLRPLPPGVSNRKNHLRLLGAVVLGGIVGPALLLWGLDVSSSTNTALLLNLETVATALVAFLLFREHLGARSWLANAGVVLAGVLLALRGGSQASIGALLVALGCVAWAFDNCFTASIDGIRPGVSTFWKGLIAGAFNFTVGTIAAGGWPALTHAAAALAVGALSYGLSIVLYIRAAQSLGAARSQMVFASAPFIGVILSVTALGEPFLGHQLAAGLVMLASLVILFTERHAHEHEHEKMDHVHAHRHDDSHHGHAHEGESGFAHSHWHHHPAKRHSHPHWPDLHHRHDH